METLLVGVYVRWNVHVRAIKCVSHFEGEGRHENERESVKQENTPSTAE